uniref:RWD domain-containing protein 3 n=1 Tax=Tetradesmus obliquus TaxID=3088 RepID=A0A383WAE9_TETOB|eukprot:jgi/Sobl393_1/19520/SZX74180.1
MDSLQLSDRRIDELVAAFAVFGERLTDVTPGYRSAAEAALQPDDACQEAGSAAQQLAGCSCSGALLCEGSSLQANLVFDMPPGYPAAAAMRCHVTSPQLSRDATDTLSQQLQQQAEALQGAECLHELADALQQQLQQLEQHQQAQPAPSSQPQQCGAPSRSSGDGGSSRSSRSADVPVARLLLRLDHMRSKASYSRTIKQWAAELSLTGLLLFWQSLILILLEGCPADLAQYLYLARTVCVDVDASGRKCRERMMTVLEDSSSSSSRAGAGTGSSAAGCLSEAAHAGGDKVRGTVQPSTSLAGEEHITANSNLMGQTCGRAHAIYRVVEVADLEDVVQLLAPTHPHYTRAELLALLGRGKGP